MFLFNRFCGYQTPRNVLWSQTEEMIVVFRSPNKVNMSKLRRGFKASFFAGVAPTLYRYNMSANHLAAAGHFYCASAEEKQNIIVHIVVPEQY